MIKNIEKISQWGTEIPRSHPSFDLKHLVALDKLRSIKSVGTFSKIPLTMPLESFIKMRCHTISVGILNKFLTPMTEFKVIIIVIPSLGSKWKDYSLISIKLGVSIKLCTAPMRCAPVVCLTLCIHFYTF